MHNRFVGNLSLFCNDRYDRLDVSELTLRLLLTDVIVLETSSLREVNDLIRVFGMQGLMALFEEGKLRLTCEAFAIGFRDDLVRNREHEFILQNVWGEASNRQWYLNKSFHNVNAGGGTVGLSRDINKYIAEPPAAESSQLVRSRFHQRLTSDAATLHEAIVLAGRATGLAPNLQLGKVEAQVKQCSPGLLHYEVTSNLPSTLSVAERRKILSGALYAVANVGIRLDAMQRHDALTQTKDTDLSLMEPQLRFYEAGMNRTQPIEQFKRVLSVRGLDAPSSRTRISVRRLIDASKSAQCLELRNYLQTKAHDESDAQVQRRFDSWHARMRSVMSGRIGGAIIWLAMKILKGQLGDAGPLANPLDKIVRKLISPGGPTLFINNTYPSLFMRPDSDDQPERLEESTKAPE